MSRFSSGCVTFAMKLPPTSAIVFPSSDLRRGASRIGSIAASGTGDTTENSTSLGVAGSGQVPSAHSSAAKTPDIAATAVANRYLIAFFMYCLPYTP